MNAGNTGSCVTSINTRRRPATENASLTLLSTLVAVEITICHLSIQVNTVNYDTSCSITFVPLCVKCMQVVFL